MNLGSDGWCSGSVLKNMYISGEFGWVGVSGLQEFGWVLRGIRGYGHPAPVFLNLRRFDMKVRIFYVMSRV